MYIGSYRYTQDKAGVYRIPCECGKVYIGETGRNISTRVKEHQAHGRLGHLDKSAIIKHSHEQDHRINWKETKLIAPVQFWHQRRVREAIEIKSHNTVPQDIGFYINDIWSPLLKPTLPSAAHHNTDTLHRTHIQPATNSHASPGKHNLNPSRPNVHPSSPTKASASVQHSPEDEQSILFETSSPQRLFSEPTLRTWLYPQVY